MTQSNNIFISNLPNQVTEFGVLKLLSQFGKITDFNFPVHKDRKQSGQTLGYCFVSYENQSDAFAAIAKLKYSNSILFAKFSKPKLICDEIEFKCEYDEKVIMSEIEKEEGIIEKEKLTEILERSKKIHGEKKIIISKKKTKNSMTNSVKTFNEKRNQIRRIEEALKKYR